MRQPRARASMRRDLARLSSRQFDLLIIGGGIHGLAAAYDAALRGLDVALIERGDFGAATSGNHLRTVHGGLRYMQTADFARMRESIVERRTMARIAPHLLTRLPFLMPTYRKLTRSRLAMRVAFTVDAVVGRDRNDGVAPRLHLPTGRILRLGECLERFPDVQRRGLTGAALWHDYQVRNPDRLNLSFGIAAAASGACLANYVEAGTPTRSGARVTGMTARDVLTGERFDVRARLTLNIAGARAGRFIEAFGQPGGLPLLKAMNLVTRRRMTGPALASRTHDGRMLFLVPWEGLAVAGTSHSRTTCGPDDTGVTEQELAGFIGELNEAFPAFRLTADDVTLVHRGVVPAARSRRGELGLEGHFRLRDHARDGIDGAMSLVGVKFTTGRGVAEAAVDVAVAKLGRRASCRTAGRPLPGAVEDPEALAAEAARADGATLDLACFDQLVISYGSDYPRVLQLTASEPSLASPVATHTPVLGAQIVHAVRDEMAQTLTDVVVRRVPLGATGHPGAEVVASCAALVARELGWDERRTQEEVEALRRFYEPVTVGS